MYFVLFICLHVFSCYRKAKLFRVFLGLYLEERIKKEEKLLPSPGNSKSSHSFPLVIS